MVDYKEYTDDGIYSLNQGEAEDAIEKFSKSIELKSDWEISYFYRAVAFQSLEKFDDAILDYTKAIQINDKMTDAYYNRAYISLTRKDVETKNIEKIVEDLEKALELDNKFIDALYAMATVQKKLGEYKKALTFLDRILEIEPQAINANALKKLLLQKYIK